MLPFAKLGCLLQDFQESWGAAQDPIKESPHRFGYTPTLHSGCFLFRLSWFVSRGSWVSSKNYSPQSPTLEVQRRLYSAIDVKRISLMLLPVPSVLLTSTTALKRSARSSGPGFCFSELLCARPGLGGWAFGDND